MHFEGENQHFMHFEGENPHFASTCQLEPHLEIGSRLQNARRNAFGLRIYDLPGPRWEGLFSSPKVNF